MSSSLNKCAKFRSLLRQNMASNASNATSKRKTRAIPLFGAHDGMTARTLVQEQFRGVYVSGGALSASYGVPDIGLLSVDHFATKIKELSLSSGLPVFADADTGFGEGEMIRRTLYEYYLAGACGFHIEDQVFPKRCGHLDGKALVPVDDMVKKVEIALDASRQVSDGQFIVCARTDARGVIGFEEAVQRALRYLDVGADMIFPEGLANEDEFKTFADEIRKSYPDALLLANMTEFGKTECIRLDRFSQIGYNVVIYPVSTLRVQMKAIEDFLRNFKESGTVEHQLPKMRTRTELYEALRYTPGTEYEYPSQHPTSDGGEGKEQ